MSKQEPGKTARNPRSVLVVSHEPLSRIDVIARILAGSSCVCITSRREAASALRAGLSEQPQIRPLYPSPVSDADEQRRAVMQAVCSVQADDSVGALCIDNLSELAVLEGGCSIMQSVKNSGVDVVCGCDSLTSLNTSYGLAVEQAFDCLVLAGGCEPYAADAACLAASCAAAGCEDVRASAFTPARLAAMGAGEVFVAAGGRGAIVSAEAVTCNTIEEVARG